jgi:hypothetical protein
MSAPRRVARKLVNNVVPEPYIKFCTKYRVNMRNFVRKAGTFFFGRNFGKFVRHFKTKKLY